MNMFLSDLFKYSKFLFTTLIFFLLLFIYLNYKWGMVASPVNQFGMYSGKFFMNDTLALNTVRMNNEEILQDKLSVIDIDFIQEYPQSYKNQQSTNKVVFGSMKKMIKLVLIDSNYFYNQIIDKEFYAWYTKMVCKRLGKPLSSVELSYHKLVWRQNKFEEIVSPEKNIFIAP